MITKFFHRDGSWRDLQKNILDFLAPQQTTPEQEILESNQHLFFKTLGSDFSKHSHLTYQMLPEPLKKKVSGNIENQCHDVAIDIISFFPERFYLVWGFVDWYSKQNNKDTYGGTFCHSFLLEKDSGAILDPILLKISAGLSIHRGTTQNHFGVIISKDRLFNFLFEELPKNMPSNNNFCGHILQNIFTNTDSTKRFITEIQNNT